MIKNHESAGQKSFNAKQKLYTKPLDRWLFKQIAAKNIPYTDSIKADIQIPTVTTPYAKTVTVK